MADEIIQKHNFKLAKRRILSTSKKVPSSVSLNRFSTEGSIFPWNEHNITGNEANRLLVSPLQEILISQNRGIKDLFKIAKDVYTALDSLDNEYIAGIVGAVEAAKIASNQALDASEKAKVAQADIKRTIEALQKAVSILNDFKADVTIKLNTLTAIPSKISNIDSQIKNIEQDYDSVIQVTKGFQSTSATLNSISHLKDVDTIWNDVEEHKQCLEALQEQLDSFISETNKIVEEIMEAIKNQAALNNDAHLVYEKRIKTAYYIGGGAVGLSFLNYLLQLLDVL